MSDTFASEFREIIGESLALIDAAALIDIMCFATLTLPSGVTLNGPSDDVLGREDAAHILAPLTEANEPIRLKAAYDARGTLFSLDQFNSAYQYWLDKLEARGIQVNPW